MFTHCTFCHRPFDDNESLEHLRAGREVAFDPDRGRLWHICRSCRRWSLAPIEERWEALEELERLTRDRARLLAETDNVALLRAEDLKIVRVGRTNLDEEAWWRFGREFKRRRSIHKAWGMAGMGGFGVLLTTGTAGAVGGGLGIYWTWRLAKRAPELGRFLKFGKTAWKGRALCTSCGAELDRVPFDEIQRLTIGVSSEGEAVVTRRCRICRSREPGAGFLWTGAEGDHLLRRSLAYRNFAGASDSELKFATNAIEGAGSTAALTRTLASHSLSIGRMGVPNALALEIAINEETERRLLEMELAELEARWRVEEEIAAIVDNELTPLAGFAAFRRSIRRGMDGLD
ncbi:MAG: hypothetical protein R3195_05565 [Gemmatimonadota bacterium]|nr:hypothetical protein [Gemmatimonadota bacterium]